MSEFIPEPDREVYDLMEGFVNTAWRSTADDLIRELSSPGYSFNASSFAVRCYTLAVAARRKGLELEGVTHDDAMALNGIFNGGLAEAAQVAGYDYDRIPLVEHNNEEWMDRLADIRAGAVMVQGAAMLFDAESDPLVLLSDLQCGERIFVDLTVGPSSGS